MVDLPSIKRRALLKLGGGGLLSGFVGAPAAKATQSFGLLTAAAQQTGEIPTSNPAHRLFHRWRQFKSPYPDAYRYTSDAGWLDPDIACLKSVSPAMKLFMQRARDEEQQTLVDAAAKFFGVEL